MGKDAEIPLSQDVKKDPEGASRSLRKIAMILNSLIRRGFVRRTSKVDFEILVGGANGVVDIANGTGLGASPSPITENGTLFLLNTAVAPGGNFSFSNISVNAQGQITAASNGTLPTANYPVTTKGDLFTFGNAATREPVGADGQILFANSSQTTGLQWANAPSSGGNFPVTTKGDLFGFSNAADRVPIGSDGYVLTANSNAALGLDWEAPSGGNGSGNDPISSIYPVFTPTGNDDEFSSGSFTGWTAVNSGSHAVTTSETNNVLSVLHPGGDAAAEFHAWLRQPTITAGSYVECAIRGAGINSTFPFGGVIFADGTTYGSGTQAIFYYSANEGKTNLMHVTGFNTNAGNNLTGALAGPCSDIFVRLKYNGSNSFSGYLSADGVLWALVNTVTFTFTPTWAGFFVTTYGSPNPYSFSFRYCKFR